ncbi:hypothetical protein DFH06DRAFT_1177314 [Mycena polygramma]|nr:hypothetical protein DFH06DRAFT_1177314 [Mycena polygramma]
MAESSADVSFKPSTAIADFLEDLCTRAEAEKAAVAERLRASKEKKLPSQRKRLTADDLIIGAPRNEPRHLTRNASVARATTDIQPSAVYSREAIPYVRRSVRVTEAQIDSPAVPGETAGHTLESFAESLRRSSRKAAGNTIPTNSLSLSSRALRPRSMSTPAVPSSSSSRPRPRKEIAAPKETPSTTEPELFFVKRIIEARVVTEGARRPNKVIWEYLAEWDGYDHCTWEPIESFKGSKHAVGLFWANADCGGRNPDQLFKFKTGEVIKLKQPMSKGNSRKRKRRASVTEIVGTRVFALWAEDKHYYSAVVQRRVGYRSHSYIVRFDDTDAEVKLPLKHMRPCSLLRKGDTVILQTDNVVVADLRSDSAFLVKKAVDYSAVKISPYYIEKEWAQRQLAHEDVVCQCEPLM